MGGCGHFSVAEPGRYQGAQGRFSLTGVGLRFGGGHEPSELSVVQAPRAGAGGERPRRARTSPRRRPLPQASTAAATPREPGKRRVVVSGATNPATRRTRPVAAGPATRACAPNSDQRKWTSASSRARRPPRTRKRAFAIANGGVDHPGELPATRRNRSVVTGRGQRRATSTKSSALMAARKPMTAMTACPPWRAVTRSPRGSREERSWRRSWCQRPCRTTRPSGRVTGRRFGGGGASSAPPLRVERGRGAGQAACGFGMGASVVSCPRWIAANSPLIYNVSRSSPAGCFGRHCPAPRDEASRTGRDRTRGIDRNPGDRRLRDLPVCVRCPPCGSPRRTTCPIGRLPDETVPRPHGTPDSRRSPAVSAGLLYGTLLVLVLSRAIVRHGAEQTGIRAQQAHAGVRCARSPRFLLVTARPPGGRR